MPRFVQLGVHIINLDQIAYVSCFEGDPQYQVEPLFRITFAAVGPEWEQSILFKGNQAEPAYIVIYKALGPDLIVAAPLPEFASVYPHPLANESADDPSPLDNF